MNSSIYTSDSTLLLLRNQYNLSKKLYFDYLLNFMGKYWYNIYEKISFKMKKK